jgi:hypothetical protein
MDSPRVVSRLSSFSLSLLFATIWEEYGGWGERVEAAAAWWQQHGNSSMVAAAAWWHQHGGNSMAAAAC